MQRALLMLFISVCLTALDAQTLVIKGLQGDGNLVLTTDYWEAFENQKVYQLSVTNGQVNTLLNLETPSLAYATYDSQNFPIYLVPGQTTALTFQGKQFHASDASNNLLGKVAAAVGSFQKVDLQNSMINYYVLEGLLQNPNKYPLIEAAVNQSNATSTFKNLIKEWMQYENATAKGHAGQTVPRYPVAQEQVPGCTNYLAQLALYHTSPAELQSYRGYYAVFQSFSDKTSGHLRSLGQKELIKNIYTSTQDDAFLELAYDIFDKTNTSAAYADELVELYGSRLGRNAKIAVPDIAFLKDNGQYGQLLDYQGKVIYLSFWASWCKPCISGFEKTAATRKELQNMGVILLNVSIDKTQDAWRGAMDKHNPMGVNVWATDLPRLAQDYQLTSIPLYHIIDKKGQLAYLSDERGRNIYAEFQKLVDQK